jgi:hypothetical protein
MMNRLLAVLLLVVLSGMCFAADAIYPGSKLVFDVNLTEQDFLPALKQALPGMAGLVGTRIPGYSPAAPSEQLDALAKEVVDSLKGLKSVSVAYYELANPDGAKITQFYAPKIGLTEGWNPVVRLDTPKGGFRLYVKPGLEEMFSLAVAPNGYVVVHTTGPIDATRLAELAAKTIPQIISSRPAPVPEPEPGPSVEPAPEPAPDEVPAEEPAPEPAPAQ